MEAELAPATVVEGTPATLTIEKKPKPKPKGPKYEGPTLGRIIHVEADRSLGQALLVTEGTHLAAIVTGVLEELGLFKVHIYSPTTNPDVRKVELRCANDDGIRWHWPERD